MSGACADAALRPALGCTGDRFDPMPLHTGDALILRTYKLGEADRIVVFLTADRGKRRGVAKGARRTRSPFSGALEPMTRGRVAYFERERRELVRLRYVEPVCSPLASDSVEALAHAGYFAELIDEWAPEADPNEKLFRLGTAVVESLAAGIPIGRLARYFEFWLLRLQGVYPPVTAPPDEGGGLSSAAMSFLAAARVVGPMELGSVELSAAADRELVRVHQRLIRTHLDKELKSVRVLRSLTRAPRGD